MPLASTTSTSSATSSPDSLDPDVGGRLRHFRQDTGLGVVFKMELSHLEFSDTAIYERRLYQKSGTDFILSKANFTVAVQGKYEQTSKINESKFENWIQKTKS